MSLKTKLKPYSFVLGLILSFFCFNNAFADFGTYVPYYPSTDYNFRVTDIYFDSNNLLTYNFSLSSTSVKPAFYVVIDGGAGIENIRPSVIFSNCSGSTCTTFHSHYDYNYSYPYNGYYCDNSEGYQIVACNILNAQCYVVPRGHSITCHSYRYIKKNYDPIYNPNGINETDLLNYGVDLKNTQKYLNGLNIMYSDNADGSYQIIGTNPSLFTSITNGACGSADNSLPTTIPIPNAEACSSGTVDTMHDYYTFDGVVYAWECLGSGGGITVSCNTLPYSNPVNGACGSADGTSVYNQPDEYEKCSAGATNSTTNITLTGWSWTCEGLYGGTNAYCSADYSGGGTPPTIPDTAPIPTPTDCDTYSGIEKVLCNFGNTIQGMFLPSTEKVTELQETVNSVGNVFPFNYLRAIGSTFRNMSVTQGSLTMTMFGTTATLGAEFWTLPIFSKVRLFASILILLMFTFWAIGYIKHFFK